MADTHPVVPTGVEDHVRDLHVPLQRHMTRFLFVGEKRSPTAIKKGWTWHSGRVAARTLHEALRAAGIDPSVCLFVNAWHDDGEPCWAVESMCSDDGVVVVALGQKVARRLASLRIPHRAMVHPAARGHIRKRERYHAHVAEVLR